MQKYELLKEDFIEVDGIKLYRIRALKDFGDVKNGDLGGYIESERNLSHNDDCWVGDNACVYEYGWVRENAQVYGNAQVNGDAWVYEDAQVYGNAKVGGGAKVYGGACVYGNTQVSGYDRVTNK